MSRRPLLPTPVGQDLVGLTALPKWDAVFGFPGPIEIEIGCGAGGFVLEAARRSPQTRFVAFEWRKKYARLVDHAASRMGLSNLKVIEADARAEIPRLFGPGSLQAIHLQFPDPWWKRSHQKRAVLTFEMAKTLLELTQIGGTFDLRTDVEERAKEMVALLEDAGWTNPLGSGAFHPFDPLEVPSTRERRYLITGQKVYRARLKKDRR